MSAESASRLTVLLIELGKALDKAGELYRDYLAELEAARAKVAEQAAGDLAAVDGKPTNHAPVVAPKEET